MISFLASAKEIHFRRRGASKTMNKIILGLGAAVGLSVAAVAIASPAGRVPDAIEKTSSSLAVKLVATANQAEEAAFVALGSDAAAIAPMAGNGPAVAGEGAAQTGRSAHATARDAGVSEDVVALIVVAIENDIKAQVAAGVPTLSISTALTRASNTPNLSKNVAAAFGLVQHDLADLFDQAAPGSINGRSRNLFAAAGETSVGGPTRRAVASDPNGGGGDGGSNGGGSTDGGSNGGGSTDGGSNGGGATDGGSNGGGATDGGSNGGGSTDGGSSGGGSTDGGSNGGGSTDGGSNGGGTDDGSNVPTTPTDPTGGSGYRPG